MTAAKRVVVFLARVFPGSVLRLLMSEGRKRSVCAVNDCGCTREPRRASRSDLTILPPSTPAKKGPEDLIRLVCARAPVYRCTAGPDVLRVQSTAELTPGQFKPLNKTLRRLLCKSGVPAQAAGETAPPVRPRSSSAALAGANDVVAIGSLLADVIAEARRAASRQVAPRCSRRPPQIEPNVDGQIGTADEAVTHADIAGVLHLGVRS
jgi:hypothetical protein